MKEIDKDIGDIAICAVRYALGRQTYMPSVVQGFVMTRSEEMEALKAKRDEINRKIRALKTEGVVEAGNARLAPKQTYAYRADEVWQVGYAVPLQGYHSGGMQYRSLAHGTRQECIDSIPDIIEDLKTLYEAAKGAQHEGD